MVNSVAQLNCNNSIVMSMREGLQTRVSLVTFQPLLTSVLIVV